VAANGNNFWYYTTIEGKPVEFGEGCQISHDPAACPGADLHAIAFWQFNVSSIALGAGSSALRHATLPAACAQSGAPSCHFGPHRPGAPVLPLQ